MGPMYIETPYMLWVLVFLTELLDSDTGYITQMI